MRVINTCPANHVPSLPRRAGSSALQRTGKRYPFSANTFQISRQRLPKTSFFSSLFFTLNLIVSIVKPMADLPV
jgi:hypothetical protein